MAPLWKKQKTKNKNEDTINTHLSPNYIIHFMRLAQDASQSLLRTVVLEHPINKRTIKGLSLFVSGPRSVTGSMTVEAAMVLPLFLFFFLNLCSVMEMIRLHGKMEVALWETGNRLSVYGAVLGNEEALEDKEKDSVWQELSDVAFSYVYVKGQLVNYLGKSYLDQSPLVQGSGGLIFLGSEYFTHDDRLELVVSYRVEPPFSVPGVTGFLMENHYYGHLWTGYEIPGTGSLKEKEKVYYVTENGQVYHLSTECTHLKLSKKQVALGEALSERNSNGRRYTLCDKCKNRSPSLMVWISDQGEHYHYSEECSGLKRTVYTITQKELGAYRPCTRCAA